MDDVVSSPPVPNVKKRPLPQDELLQTKPLNLQGKQFIMPTPPATDDSSNTSPDGSADNDDKVRDVSPAPSSSALSSTVEVESSNALLTSVATADPSAASACTSAPPPAKRRKLTPSEKLEKQRAKEAADREKAASKARKDEERRVREEERRKKDEEKAEAKRVQDEEKRRKAEEKEVKKREKELEGERRNQEKEAKKRKEEEERLKKERSQMRLGVFFQKPATPAKATSTEGYGEQPRARRRSLSLELNDAVAENIASPVKGTLPPTSDRKPSARKPIASAYHREFLPFQLQSNSRMAAIRQASSDEAQHAFDRELKAPSLEEQYDLGMIASYQGHAEIGHYFSSEREAQRGMSLPLTRDIVDRIQGTSRQPIDLTEDTRPQSAADLLRDLPVKHLHFAEDVRPAYYGTYNKMRSPRTKRKVQRNPFTRARPDTNYDYDSEAEWEEPEEGDEEVLSDEEDEVDSQADADDEGFLDDEEDTAKSKRRVIVGELIPESTGLCWASGSGRISIVDNVETVEQPVAMQGMSMGLLLPVIQGQTIDPFSTIYWEAPVVAPPPAATSGLLVNNKPASKMVPPRAPLQPRLNANGALDKVHELIGARQGEKGPITSAIALQPAKRGPKPAPKTLSKEDLEEFKEAVIGSPIGKLELQKALKQRFPKMTNEVIKETLSSQFAHIGKTKTDKKWVFVGEP